MNVSLFYLDLYNFPQLQKLFLLSEAEDFKILILVAKKEFINYCNNKNHSMGDFYQDDGLFKSWHSRCEKCGRFATFFENDKTNPISLIFGTAFTIECN